MPKISSNTSHSDILEYTSSSGTVEAKLIDFSIDSSVLKASHKEWLDEFIVPIAAAGGGITLIGQASRTGTDLHNQRLSKQRAHAVLVYIRNKMNSYVKSDACVDVKPDEFEGVGETAAAKAGQADNTEDSFYRAVRISAWYKPYPPPVNRLTGPAQAMVKRVTSRLWQNFTIQEPRMGEPDFGPGLGDLVRNSIDAYRRGGSDSRTYSVYRRYYRVNHVFDNYEMIITNKLLTKSILIVRRITYTWGPPLKNVTLRNENWKNGHLVKENTQVFPRAKIWKHTYSPDAKILG